MKCKIVWYNLIQALKGLCLIIYSNIVITIVVRGSSNFGTNIKRLKTNFIGNFSQQLSNWVCTTYIMLGKRVLRSQPYSRNQLSWYCTFFLFHKVFVTRFLVKINRTSSNWVRYRTAVVLLQSPLSQSSRTLDQLIHCGIWSSITQSSNFIIIITQKFCSSNNGKWLKFSFQDLVAEEQKRDK